MRFAPVVFLSALLLFLMQSVAGKQLLPWFGGAPGTWAACMMFFQALLLAGYGYAWALDRWCPPRWQRAVHCGLLVLACAQLGWWAREYGAPLLAPDAWKPQGHEAPAGLILKSLAAATGLPFVILAATSPLLQRWAAESGLPAARIYRLYALSNAGSLIGLLSFPFLLEPGLALPSLATGWAWTFAALTLASAVSLFPAGERRTPSTAAVTSSSAVSPAPAPASACRRLLWILLSAVASAVLLATTNQLCQEIAMVPFLWVLPLALYLTAFMLAFHDARWYRREWLAPPAALLSLVSLGFAIPGTGIPVVWVMITLGAWLFLFCWMCLGELFRLRPATASGLTGYYLAIALGGLLGGAAIAVGAPLLLSSVTEFPWAMCAGWLLLTVLFWRDRTSLLHRGNVLCYVATVFFGITSLLLLINLILPATTSPWVKGWIPAVTAGTVLTLACYALTRPFPGWQRWRGWPQLLTGMVIFFAFAFTLDDSRGAGTGVLAKGRNFYGAVRVQKDERGGEAYVRLVHGQVNHGLQFTDPVLRRQPAGYCDVHSGVGIAIAGHPRRHPAGVGAPQPLRIGVAGLGVGAMAAYLHAGDAMRFYEVNPLVVDWAAGPNSFFSYIKDSPGSVETVTGDARLALERELRDTGSQRYDLLILDAFSSDSVPVHLLTVEAFALYLRHLRDDDSLLAVNISNRYLDFRPLLSSIAARFDLRAQLFFHPGQDPVRTPNLWMILSRTSPAFFQHPAAIPTESPNTPVLWTDTHSDVFSLLRWTSAPLQGLSTAASSK